MLVLEEPGQVTVQRIVEEPSQRCPIDVDQRGRRGRRRWRRSRDSRSGRELASARGGDDEQGYRNDIGPSSERLPKTHDYILVIGL